MDQYDDEQIVGAHLVHEHGLKQENGLTALPGIPTPKVRCLINLVKLKKKGHWTLKMRCRDSDSSSDRSSGNTSSS